MSQGRGFASRFVAAVVVRPVTTTMVTIAVILFGLVAATRLPVELLPDLGYPSITVRTEYADAAPSEVEELVTRPVEELVGAVPGLATVESSSREGVSEVVLDFRWGTSIDSAMADVREKLDRVRLPVSAERPVVLRYDPSTQPVMRLALRAPEGEADLARLRYLADRRVKRTLEKLPGVAAAALHGGDEEEIRVDVDADRLAALGIDSQAVVDAIRSENINRPGGGLTEGDDRYLIRTVHEAKTPAELERIIVRDEAGRIVRLGDVAEVSRGPVEREEVALVGGAEAVELGIYREGDANTVSVARNVRAALESLDLDEGYEVVVLADQARFIEAAIEEVLWNTIVGAGLAVLVLLFFLRDLRATAIIGVSIPISVLATFLPLQVFDVTLNMMSLGGLALGVGMLVDNGIVALESIARAREEFPDRSARENATRGTAEIAGSIFASTLTTVAVFLPMAFVEGVAGQLVRDLSIAVSASIVSSMVVSLTLVPVLAGLERAPKTQEAGERPSLLLRTLTAIFIVPLALVWKLLTLATRGLSVLGQLAAKGPWTAWMGLERLYPKMLGASLRAPGIVVAVVLVACAASSVFATAAGRTLVPELRQGEFFVQVNLPPGTSLEHNTALTRSLLRRISADERVELAYARVGSVTQGGSASGALEGPQLAQIDVRVAPEHADSIEALERDIAALVATGLEKENAKTRLDRPALLSFEAPLEIQVFSEDLTAARTHAAGLLGELESVDDLADISPDDLEGRPEVRVDFDREALGRATLNVDTAAAAVQRSIQGEIAGPMHAADRQLDIRVRLPRADRSSVEDVGRIVVGVANGAAIPLRSVARLEEGIGPSEIRRIGGRRGLRIQARVESADLGAVAERVESVLALTPRRPGLTTLVAGQAAEMEQSLTSLGFTALVSIFLVYVVMASSFESLHHPLLIMFTVPLAAAGVVVTCALTGTPISAMVGIGAIILGGIVVNNAIVLIHAVNAARGEGSSVREALVHAGRLRLRPIVMTAATTILGLLPMALGLGEGAALRQPLALSVIGGLAAATVLTLIVIPSLYALVPGRRREAWASEAPSEPDPPEVGDEG